jgi:putative solute:sodium symporter small subunit
MAAKKRVEVNFFRPSTAGMKAETRIAASVLILWCLLSFGIPLFIFFAGLNDPSGLGESFITRVRFLGFPLHYWLIAQGCTIGYILLCKLYCILWDRRVSPSQRAPH